MNALVIIGLFLVLLLAVLLGVFFLQTKNKKASLQNTQKLPDISLESLLKKIESKASTRQELKDTLDLVLEHFGNIDNFSLYENIIRAIILHPNTNKNLILEFDKELSKRNPEYKKRISDTLTDALNLR
ncbi:MAG: hypothetical protein Q9M32_06545 [Sulfurimonas sp.]|nr:hypothetical protein [Sulfurimonas sp.]MDQ7060633.1 hypothetical protein [Sulfurimonas sp.]